MRNICVNRAQRSPSTSCLAPGNIRQLGTSLIEVLIALVVFGVGMLGMAALSGISIKTSDSSQQRADAALLAYNMLDRLKTNKGSSGVSTSALGGAYDNILLCKTFVTGCTPNSDLTGTDIAKIDLRDWQSSLNDSNLPTWQARIVRTGTVFTVSVQWDDTRAKGQRLQVTTKPSCVDGSTAISDAIEQICFTTQL